MAHKLEHESTDSDTGELYAADLRRYAAEVTAELGIGLESCAIDPAPPASVYIALDTTLPDHADRDLALLWDERTGWSVAIETHSGEDLIVIAQHKGNHVPDARQVAKFVAGLAKGRSARQ